MKAQDLRLGNCIQLRRDKDWYLPIKEDQYTIVESIGAEGINLYLVDNYVEWESLTENYEPIPLTEEILLKCGFDWMEKDSYCNGKQWTYQIKGERYEDGTINRDGTWFDGIGDYSWLPNSTTPKTMVVNTLCRGNYVCRSVDNLHQLQNLYLALTGEELNVKL